MKLLGIILFMLLSAQLYAQRVNGVVLDKATGVPVPGAVIKKGNTIQLSSLNGGFILSNSHPGDSVRITLMGYKTYYLVLGQPGNDTMRVYLVPGSIMLNNVNIYARHDRVIDSLQNRREFAGAFAYKAPTLMDAFNRINPYAYVPNNYIYATNSTASLVSMNLLSVIDLFGKNKTPDTKLHKLVINDEKVNYIDERFSKQKITALTKLQGGPLGDFIYLYRPNIEDLKKMSEYDLVIYIKKSYAEYIANKDKVPAIK